MKLLATIFIITMLALILSVPTFGGPMDNWVGTLYSSATGTTAAVTGSVITLPYTMRDFGCEVVSGETTTGITVVIRGGVGYATPDLRALGTITTSTRLVTYQTVTGTPLRVIQAVVTSPTNTTSTHAVRCTGL